MSSTSLVFLAGPNAGRRYKLAEGEYIIGRRSDCQVFVPDMRVSRQHARIFRDGSQWMLEDLGSNNGTIVNGEAIQTVALVDDDEIVIADNRIRVESEQRDSNMDFAESNVTMADVANPALYVSSRDPNAPRQNRWHRQSLPGRVDPANPRHLQRKLHALQTIMEIAASIAAPDDLMESVVGQLLEVFAKAHSAGVLVENERTKKLEVRCHRERENKHLGFGGDMQVPGTIVDIVVRDQRGVLMAQAGANQPAFAGPDPANEPNGSRMGAPLQARGVHYGVMYVECRDQSFRKEDLDLLTSIAAHTGLVIHTARMHGKLQARDRLERDLRVARQIQRSLMRDPPQVRGLEFAIHYEPAYQIGGDFYDFIWHDNEHLGLMVGDVSGKAISAALYMARLTSEIRGRVGIAGTPGRLLERVNQEMVKLGDDGMFATLVYAVYHLESRILAFTNAGHCTPLLRRGDRVFPIHADRAHIPPIGILPDLDIGEARIQLYQNDLIVFVSDGIIEAHSPSGEEYGVERLSASIQKAQGSTEEVIREILKDVDRHVATGSQGDDMTVVAMAIKAGRARRQPTTIAGHAMPDRWDGRG